jgi:hypothetical protein
VLRVSYAFNPTPVEKFLLGMIRLRESAINYAAPPKNPPYATASGGYQFIRATWAMSAAATGVGQQYAFAFLASQEEQDINALWLLRMYGANSSRAWKASGPYPTGAEVLSALNAFV